MSEGWQTILALALTTAAIRASGPLAFGGRALPARLTGVIELLAPALLSALIVVETVGAEKAVEIDPRLAGVIAAGGVLAWRRSALFSAIVVAAAVTALIRALT